MWILYILFGIIGGVFCGLGMGGGTLLIPLISMLGISQKACQVINLVAFVLSASVSLIFHFKNGLVETKNLFAIIVPACLGALVGSIISVIIKGEILKRCFGGFLIVVALVEIFKALLSVKSKNRLKNLKKIK
ncbi:MAG: sulfite exporter TauE/SafE family protein [Clostridia bacterium]|nr:sulfite exporter TauE/SafE family protein [Clostridia bacterium]